MFNQCGEFGGSGTASVAGGSTSTGKQTFYPKVGETQVTVTDYTVNAQFGKADVDGQFQTREKFAISGQVYKFTAPFLGGEIVTTYN